ncbi:hypothetical protein [Acetivibrio straminisolvens]|uniref:Mobile element protein n=1 Tax=Acetivibrio straminisolvens JCM 21531 TaxID=1294263 RepID=W4V7W2_9FIRM|nr:hypothetical protein [Acetivibrio straminisolvens]GAE89317.1 hypothetical protein JCM21531_2830 [Acetivibrio straminisolvens JCM 21531]
MDNISFEEVKRTINGCKSKVPSKPRPKKVSSDLKKSDRIYKSQQQARKTLEMTY